MAKKNISELSAITSSFENFPVLQSVFSSSVQARTLEQVVQLIMKANSDSGGFENTFLPTWYFIDSSETTCEELWKYFCSEPKVKIFNQNFTSLPKEIDCILALGNQFGSQKKAEDWNELRNIFGSEILNEIRSYIKDNYEGEAPPFTSFVLPTSHPTIKYLLYANDVNYASNLQQLIWSILTTLTNHNREMESEPDKQIKVFASKSYNIRGSSQALKIFLTYKQCLFPMMSDNVNEIQKLKKILNEPIQIPPFFTEQDVISGILQKRGFISKAGLQELTKIFQNPNSIPELKKAAGRTIIHYVFQKEDAPKNLSPLVQTCFLPLLELIDAENLKAYLEINSSELEKIEKIDSTTSSQVWRGKWKGQSVAIKEVTISPEDVSLKREINIMSLIYHENILPLLGANLFETQAILITPFIKGGNLRELLNSKQEITFEKQIQICLEIASAMDYLHSKQIIHRDLKSLNVLMDEGTVKLCDLGSARKIAKQMTGSVGTVCWMAPELFKGLPYNEKTDIYSFGIVMWEILTRKSPFEDVSSLAIPVHVSKGERPKLPKKHSGFEKLIKKCWAPTPETRPSFSQIIKSLQYIDLDGLISNEQREKQKSAKKEMKKMNQKIEKIIKEEKKKFKEIRLLLLGTADSGKTTLNKQMKILHSNGFTQSERLSFKAIIQSNMIFCMKDLLKEARNANMELEDKEAVYAIENCETFTFHGSFIQRLWNDPIIQELYRVYIKNTDNFSISTFFENAEKFEDPSYLPNDQEILNCRQETKGFTETKVLINKVEFNFIDVAGGRNDRMKFAQLFEDITAVLFIVAINEYDMVMAEDGTNRLHESINYFKQIIENKYFQNTSFILFLNKRDLFIRKIKEVDLKVCFPEYQGGNKAEKAADFIKKTFEKQHPEGKKKVFSHFTTATDTQNIKRVFKDVYEIILHKFLEYGGLV